LRGGHASSSALTELAKGKTLKQAGMITRNDVVKELGGLPAEKVHCSVLAQDALKKAIKDYKSNIFNY
jgi:nitrogen fixation NifU-like protein